ncbi:MAG: alpha-amylase family glycosyl hydrolase [bacterium]
MRSPVRSLLAAIALIGCQIATRADAQALRSPPAWTRNAVMYEVNVRQYTPQGTFTALRPHLPRLKSLGVDLLWIMPVQPIGKLNRKGGLGSYYSISDYRAINPEFGSAADFKAFVADAHAHGLKVILDWVPNHTSFDHVWIAKHPTWYLHKADGSVSNAVNESGAETDWTDVAQLNYDNPDMRRAMLADMRYWLDVMKVDGFRCDFAAGVPMDFWVEARRTLAAVRPDIFMLAEAEMPALGEAFDMSYGWELHHLLNDVAQGKKNTPELDAYLQRQKRAYHANDFHMYFTTNHDENSWNGTEFERMGANHVPAFILAATMRGGMPLLYTGQEVSLNKRLRFFEKDTVDWSGTSLAGFYSSVFALKHAEEALWNGGWGGAQTPLTTDGGNRVYAFTRTRGGSAVLVAANFGDAPVSVSYKGLAQPGGYTDWFAKSAVQLAGSGKLDIPAHGYRVLVRGRRTADTSNK